VDSQQLPQLEVDDKLFLIQNLINTYDYDVAVKECCAVFEIVFRKIVQQAMVSIPYSDRRLINETEIKIGKGMKGVENFSFGELVGLFREVQLLEKWSKHTSKELGLIKTLDYSSIVNLRNKITHQGATCTRAEANIVYEYLKNLLAVLGFADLESSINHSFSQSSPPGHAENKKTLSEKLPSITKTRKEKSVYSSSKGNENSRLKTQGNNLQKFDLRAFNEFLGKTDRNNLTGLDVGCAGGYVTTNRFSQYKDRFRKVIGIDINSSMVDHARSDFPESLFSFHTIDIENETFDSRMKEIAGEYDIEQFDLIFSSLTLHHLANPLKALLKLRKLLKKDGIIILRGSDDGTKIGYPDKQALIESLVKLTSEVKGVSDRINGRKLYTQVKKSGFKNIKVLYNIKDTANMEPEERYALFEESFSYRINYFKNQLDTDPENENYLEEYKWVKDALEELEVEFLDESFFYQEMDYIVIGTK
jgi:SAM-dependent methyltransferase